MRNLLKYICSATVVVDYCGKKQNIEVRDCKNEKEVIEKAKKKFMSAASGFEVNMDELKFEIAEIDYDIHGGKAFGLAAMIVAALGTSIGFFSASFTSVAQNTVTLYRNKMSGELVFKADPGTKMLNPFLSKVGAMATTQQEAQFGNEDPNQGIAGYLPFNDSKNNEFNASVNVKWTIAHTGAAAIADARALYGTTGTVNIHSGLIVSTIRQAAIKSMQDFVLTGGITGAPIETLQILSSKSAMATRIKTDIQAALNAKYNIDGTEATGYIRLDTATIGDIVAPQEIKESIAKAAAASIESANAKQVAINQQAAAQAELTTRQQQQKVKEQEALNDLLGDPMIISSLVAAGVDTSNVNSISELATALQGKNVDLVSIIRSSKYFEKWDGRLPQTFAGNKDDLSFLIAGA